MATTRERRGGTYVMNHESFGRMMVSEQLRRPLASISKLIQAQARSNAEESSAGTPHDPKEGKTLAESYEVERGPIVVVKGQTGIPGPRISHRVVNHKRYAAVDEFGRGRARASLAGLRGAARRRAAAADVQGPSTGRTGTRNLRRAAEMYGDHRNPA